MEEHQYLPLALMFCHSLWTMNFHKIHRENMLLLSALSLLEKFSFGNLRGLFLLEDSTFQLIFLPVVNSLFVLAFWASYTLILLPGVTLSFLHNFINGFLSLLLLFNSSRKTSPTNAVISPKLPSTTANRKFCTTLCLSSEKIPVFQNPDFKFFFMLGSMAALPVLRNLRIHPLAHWYQRQILRASSAAQRSGRRK